MMHSRRLDDGFTAVELLITLFVAAAFIIAGYQLFNVVIKDGGETRAESRAANIAYDYLRRYSDSATNPCVPSSPITNQTVTVDELVNVRITVAITCPQPQTTSLSKVDATITYNTPSSTVHYATYVDKSKGATPNPDITNGLIDWWKLNGTTTSSAGGTTLTNEGVATTTGQDGNPVGAYKFVAADQKVLYANNYSAKMVGLSAFTMTGWVYPQSNPSGHAGFFGFRDEALGGVHMLQLSGTMTLECRMRVSSSTYYQPSSLTLTANTWQMISAVYDGSTFRCYVNNATSSIAANWSSFNTTNLPFIIGRSTAGSSTFATASIDDVRVYSRALNSSEISQLIANGAR